MNSTLDEEKATTVRALEFHKFAYQSIVPCDETATALCCHGNRVFAGFRSSKIIVYEVSALGNSGYIKQAMFNSVGVPQVIKFCPIATTVVTYEKEPNVPVVDRSVSTYEMGFAKVYVYPFGLWSPDRIDESLKIVKAGRTTAQHYRGDIIRKAEYEVLEISVKPTSLQSLRDAVINAKCLIDVCPIYGNVAIAYHDSITIYRHVIAGVTNNLMDYELIMELVPLVSPLKCIEILGSYLAIGSVGEIQVFRIEADFSVDTSKRQTSVVNSTESETDSNTSPKTKSEKNVRKVRETDDSSAAFNLLALDLERIVMAQLNSKSVAAHKKNSFFTSNSDAAVELVIPKMTLRSSLCQVSTDFARERFGPSYFPLGKTVMVTWSTQFEADQLKFHGVKLPALVIRYLYFKPLKPKLVHMQFLPRYSSQGDARHLEEDLFHSFCRKNTSNGGNKHMEKLFIMISSPRSGTCVDLTGNVSMVTQFPFAGECIAMCGDENFIYVVYQNYIEVYTSKLFKPNTAMTNFNQLRAVMCIKGSSSPVPQFLVDLWVKQPIFMCGRQNFYSLTTMERSKIVNDSFLLQSVYTMSTFEGSVDIKPISTVYSLCKESIAECCESMLVQADNLKSVAKSLYLSVLLEVWIFLYNNYNDDCKDMFESVSTKLLRCVAFTKAVSELSMQTATAVSRSSYFSSEMGMTLDTPIIEVPTEVLQFLLDNCDISPLQFFNELCRCAETLESYSVNASSLNLIISSPEWIVLLLRRVKESPKILKDLLNMAQGCNPQIVTKLLYSNMRLFKFLSKLEIVDHYNTLHYCPGYVFSSFDKLGKASALSALGSVEVLSQTLSTIKVEELTSVVSGNASLIFEESSSTLEASTCGTSNDDEYVLQKSEIIQYSTHKLTRLAHDMFKLHPYFFSSALIALVSTGAISIEDSISFCTGSRAEEMETLFKGFSILQNNAFKFLLKSLMQGTGQIIRTSEDLEIVVEWLFKLYILEDSSAVSNLNRSTSKDSRKVKIESPLYSQAVQLIQSNKSFMYDPNFDWLRLLTPFKGITEELACCVPEKETNAGLRRRRNFNPNVKHTCDSIPCPCVLCRKFHIGVQNLLVNFASQVSAKTLSKLSSWLTEFCRSVDESKKAFFPNYFEGIFLLIELHTNMTRAISNSLQRYDSSIMCALLKALLISVSFEESVRLYRTLTQSADMFLEIELVILKSIGPKMKFGEMLMMIPPNRAVEAYTEILSSCSDVAKCRRDTLRYRRSTLTAAEKRTSQHAN